MSEQTIESELPAAGWRLKLGVALFVVSIILPVAGVPLVTAMDMSTTVTASLSGVVLVAGEVMGISAVAVMGKNGYFYVKGRVLVLLRRYGPPQEVSRRRYTIGLVFFCLPILFGWLSPYIIDLLPGFTRHPLYYALAGDLLFLTGLFVLGGKFWDKIRSLFIYDAEVRLSANEGGKI